jgi:hypothetical protein
MFVMSQPMIKWGNIVFDGPFSILEVEPPRKKAVYTIMTEGRTENTYYLLYVGESETLDEIRQITEHPYYPRFLEYAQSDWNIYYAYRMSPSLSRKERQEIVKQIMKTCKPLCIEG